MADPLIRVVGLHKLPFDAARFRAELGSARVEEACELAKQFRENWDNAWIVVVESDGAADALDFDKFNYGEQPDSPDNQAAWNEVVLDSSPQRTRAAFFLHYVTDRVPLWYGAMRLNLPRATEAPAEISGRVSYESPD